MASGSASPVSRNRWAPLRKRVGAGVMQATWFDGGFTSNENLAKVAVLLRLKASYDISSFGPVTQKFLRAFKKYGLILADNGGSRSTFYFQSEAHPSWPREINDLKKVPVSAFEAVEP